jgi:mono/diheme cytochrome c family protein
MVKFLAFIGVLAILAAIAAAVFFFFGFYNVAASVADPAIVENMLAQVRQASIARQAKNDVPSMPPENREAVMAGARAYSERGCVNCHGGPGVDWGKWSEGLRPDPPDLKQLAEDTPRNELFWVVKNGIRMTAMPSFGTTGVSDDEIWKIVAFVKQLSMVTPEEYKSWTAATPPTTHGRGR